MELVKGIPLTDYCDTHKLSVQQRLGLFQQICSAVQHAHQKGIIHRDLKPTNILVESHDGKPVPKVIDFGLAKATSGLQLTEHSLFTAFGSVLGTPLYMAPEQANFNAIDVDTRADIYALGVILYELLTGTTPLTRDTMKKAGLDEMLKLVREQEAPTPSSRLSQLRSAERGVRNSQKTPHSEFRIPNFHELDWIVLKALSKERDRRYETANGFAKDIERFLNHEPVQAGPVGAAYKLKKFVRRNRGPVLAVSLLLIVLLVGIAGTAWGLVRARHAEGRARDEAKKSRDERDEKENARAAEQAQRFQVEKQYAIRLLERTAERDRVTEEDGLLDMVDTLVNLPASAHEARWFATLAILSQGQTIQSRFSADPLYQNFHFITVPNPPLVVCWGADNVIRLHDIPTWNVIREIRPVDRGIKIHHVSLTEDKTKLVVGAMSGPYPLNESVVAFDAERLLTKSGAVIEVEPFRVLPRAADRRYHPQAQKLSLDGRLLRIETPTYEIEPTRSLVDLATELTVPIEAGSAEAHRVGDYFVVPRPPYEYPLRHRRPSVLPTVEFEIDPEILRLWATVVCMGEKDESGQFVTWDEARWETARQELIRRAAPTTAYPYLRAAAEDRHYGLRKGLDSEDRPGQETRAQRLDRCIATEPNASNYAARAAFLVSEKKYDEALADWERAAVIVGSGDHVPQDAISAMISNREIPQRIWDRLITLGERHSAGSYYRPLLFYRAGKFQRVVDEFARAEVNRCRPVGVALSMSASPLMFLNFYILHDRSGMADDTSLTLAGMSLHRLGRVEEARAVLEQITHRSQRGHRDDSLLREAFQLTGFPTWMEGK